jgi:hypothetical protein
MTDDAQMIGCCVEDGEKKHFRGNVVEVPAAFTSLKLVGEHGRHTGAAEALPSTPRREPPKASQTPQMAQTPQTTEAQWTPASGNSGTPRSPWTPRAKVSHMKSYLAQLNVRVAREMRGRDSDDDDEEPAAAHRQQATVPPTDFDIAPGKIRELARKVGSPRGRRHLQTCGMCKAVLGYVDVQKTHACLNCGCPTSMRSRRLPRPEFPLPPPTERLLSGSQARAASAAAALLSPAHAQKCGGSRGG